MSKPLPVLGFRENVTIITGASSGIGRELALQLAGQGAWLVLAARHEADLNEVAARCRERGGRGGRGERGGRALVVPTDVSVNHQCRDLIDATVSEYDRIDTLINNAGISMWSRFDELETLEFFDTIMRVNYLGSVYCTHSALPHLKKTKGRIVGVSSLAGKTGVPTRSGYAASKHAMAGFFDTLRIELIDSGVTVTMIYPDFVATETRKRAFGPDGKPMGESPVHEAEIMTAEECARQIIKAMGRRKRELIMSARGRIGQWIKLIAPGLIDRVALRAIERGR
ncbi:MAG: SDR family oxidoreductase [Gemmatimonadetes bacterium]|nr:SDR family oxidoreductase [Gemmatimonadota bacterium]